MSFAVAVASHMSSCRVPDVEVFRNLQLNCVDEWRMFHLLPEDSSLPLNSVALNSIVNFLNEDPQPH